MAFPPYWVSLKISESRFVIGLCSVGGESGMYNLGLGITIVYGYKKPVELHQVNLNGDSKCPKMHNKNCRLFDAMEPKSPP